MNRKGQVGLIEVGTYNLPRWLLYPLVILVCFTLLIVIVFFCIVGYSCIKGNCNGYYGVPIWFYRMGPAMGFAPVSYSSSSQECLLNGVPLEVNKTWGG